MNKEKIVKSVAEFVRKKMDGEGTGHDWWHIQRVWKLAVTIGKKEKADIFIVQLAALLHDIADWKFTKDDGLAARITKKLLSKHGVSEATIDKVIYIIENISYKGGKNRIKFKEVEGRVVQDADRLDAVGAIGIARTFAFGGFRGRPLHDPRIKPRPGLPLSNTTINHFYEKILLVRSKMNTKTGRHLAKHRHDFVVQYLKQFYKEWNLK
jgi:uncharacterized protein